MATARVSLAPHATAPKGGTRRISRARFSLLLGGLAAGVLFSMLLATSLGPVSVPLAESVRIVVHHVLPGVVSVPVDAVQDQIVWEFRLPRVMLGAVVGAALALVGCAMQAAVRNPLADPYFLGISSGAALGAVVVLSLGSAAVGGLSLSAAAFAGALLAMGLVYAMARRNGRITPLRMVLAGVALAYLFQAIYSFLLIKTDPY